MKRNLLLAAVILAVSGAVFARDEGYRNHNRQVRRAYDHLFRSAGQEVTLDGNLGWVDGRIVLKTDAKTYFVSGLRPLVGFVDGLKDGAGVKLAGRARDIEGVPEYGFLQAEKVTVNGKEYTLNDYGRGFGGMAGPGRGGRPGGMTSPNGP
jgi:hypothetical protein